MSKENELPDTENMHLIPAIGLSCNGCELIKYGLGTKNGQVAKCLEIAGFECLSGYIWKLKKEAK